MIAVQISETFTNIYFSSRNLHPTCYLLIITVVVVFQGAGGGKDVALLPFGSNEVNTFVVCLSVQKTFHACEAH